MNSQPTNGHRLLISTVPFGQYPQSPIDLLEQSGLPYQINPLGRPPSENELTGMLSEATLLLAGTSRISRTVLEQAPRLRLIARAGVGVENIDLEAAREHNILVTNTPLAPAPAVAEFTVGLMLALLRHIPQADQEIKAGRWGKRMGRRLENLTVGIIGAGTIGKRVIELLAGFKGKILVCDEKPDAAFGKAFQIEWTDLKDLLKRSDVVSLHVPLFDRTRRFISQETLKLMKPDSILINTARGELIDEEALFQALKNKTILAAALDVFEKEPYQGPLAQLDNCLLTSHMASATDDCKRLMETAAVQEILRFIEGKPPLCPVLIPEGMKI